MVVENHQFLRVSSAAEVRDFNLIGVSLTKPLRALNIFDTSISELPGASVCVQMNESRISANQRIIKPTGSV